MDKKDRNESAIALNTRLKQVSINPETYAHVRLHDEVKDSTTRDIEIAVYFIAVLVHNRSTATLKVNANICTIRVETEVSRKSVHGRRSGKSGHSSV